MFPATTDIHDGAGHSLVTAYALRRPDGQWSLMLVNRDQQNAHRMRIAFQNQTDKNPTTSTVNAFRGSVDISIFGREQYQWHPASTRFMAHAEHSAERAVVTSIPGRADPDGPIVHSKQAAAPDAWYDLPAASIVVIRGKIGPR